MGVRKRIGDMDAAATLAAAEANEHTLITAEVRRLQIAAHWADLHPGTQSGVSAATVIEEDPRW